MISHVVIGTAGHVDHGKTALVRALTGVETDRLREERERGITIELGFAPCALDGMDASIVDVPGHEDFVRTMVAGATGVDLALLVVAADESVMPQTVEHVAILEFLGVELGVIAVTKADLVEPAWLDLAVGDVRERVAGGRIRWTDVVPVSSVTGQGVGELRAALSRAAATVRPRRADDLFRLPVDRAFSVAGAGTVVTGTVWTGALTTGAEIVVLPGAATGRVRGIQVHGQSVATAEPGRRTALALSGIARDAAQRGTTVVQGGAWRPSETLDVVLTLLPGARAVGQRSRVRLHLGTAEVIARVTPSAEGVAPGGSGTVRLRLEEPLVARWGDRMVVRAYSPVTTIGGAVVVDPWPPSRPRRPVEAGDLGRDPAARVAAAVARAGTHGLPLGDLPVRLGIPPAEVDAVLHAMESAIVPVGKRLLDRAVFDQARQRVEAALASHHAEHRLAPGMPMEQLRQVLPDGELVDAALNVLLIDGVAVVEGGVARLAGREQRRAAGDDAVIQSVRNAIRNAGFEGVTYEELGSLRSDLSVKAVVDFLVRDGAVMRVGRDRFLDADIIQEAVRHAREELSESGQLGPAQLRERLGLTRKFSIPLLEWLDAQGFTVRRGDVRVAGPRLTGSSGAP